MRRLLPICLICLAPTLAAADDDALVAHHKFVYGMLKNILLQSAEQMPEEHYTFKPTDAVRSYGRILGHVADSQYTHCSSVLGEKNPAPKIEQITSAKADLIAALKEAFAYCDRAYGSLTAANASELVKSFGADAPKLGVLTGNAVHTVEHYGNLVTYMRLKNLVPPTSDPEFMKRQRK